MPLTAAVILCGGAGSRLWPRSRQATPKHLLPLSGSGKPLLRDTYERIRPLVDEVWVVTEERQTAMIRAVLPELTPAQVVSEPAARGTTNALGLAALALLERDPEAVMMSLPADHVVKGSAAYRSAVRSALRVAGAGTALVTVGLRPSHPATGFGYIKVGDRVRVGGRLAYRVARFVEKPDEATARAFLEEGGYYWNLAMFCWPVSLFLHELEEHGPRHAAGLKRVRAARGRADHSSAAAIYSRLPQDAIDYTVMERTRRLLLVPAAFEWLDVGSWAELLSLHRPGPDGNVLEGSTVAIDTRNSFVSSAGRLVATIGLEDMIVIETADAVLVAPRSRAQDVKRVVDELRRTSGSQYL